METVGVETEFAPAERASLELLGQQLADLGAHEFLYTILDAMPVAVMVLNSYRQILYANAPTLRIAGVENLQEILGARPGEVLYCIHAFERAGGCGTTRFCRECGAVRAIQSSLSGSQAVEECSIARRRNDAIEALDLRVWSTPMTLNDEPLIIFALMDIAHERRRQALERIFFHDVLNTVGAVQSAVELLLMDERHCTPDLLNLVYASAQQLAQEIRSQRDLLAAENGALEVSWQRVETLALSRQALELYQHHPVAQERLLRLAPEAESVEFISDPTLVGRVLGNMLKNALEASQPGEEVTLTCGGDADTVFFTVHNSAFMPEAVQLQVFQRSFSTKGRGRGLGTYSMRLLSEQYLNGEVTFESSPERGTTFTARYPRFVEGMEIPN